VIGRDRLSLVEGHNLEEEIFPLMPGVPLLPESRKPIDLIHILDFNRK